jgi:hypothetical protein
MEHSGSNKQMMMKKKQKPLSSSSPRPPKHSLASPNRGLAAGYEPESSPNRGLAAGYEPESSPNRGSAAGYEPESSPDRGLAADYEPESSPDRGDAGDCGSPDWARGDRPAESLDHCDFSAAVDTSLARQALERLLIIDADDGGASAASDSDGYFSLSLFLFSFCSASGLITSHPGEEVCIVELVVPSEQVKTSALAKRGYRNRARFNQLLARIDLTMRSTEGLLLIQSHARSGIEAR